VRSQCIAQAGRELLVSSDPSTSDFQVAGTADMCQCAQLQLCMYSSALLARPY
jgi:hypothetical protein